MRTKLSPRLRFHSNTPGVPVSTGTQPAAPAAPQFTPPPEQPPAAPVVPAPPAVPGTPAPSVTDEVGTPANPGFPAQTKIVDMTAEEQAAYHKFYSRKHEAEAKENARLLEEERQKNLTADQRREQELIAQGSALGAQPFIADAVAGRLMGITHLDEETVNRALAYTNTDTFLTEGRVDPVKVAEYATLLGGGGTPAAPPAPVAPTSLLAGLQATGAPRGGTTPPVTVSIADRQKEIEEQMRKRLPQPQPRQS